MILQPPASAASQEQTRAALEAMRAYFAATAQAQPRLERQRLAHAWLAAVRQLRTATE